MRKGKGRTSKAKTVVVAGDLIWDFNLVQYADTPAGHHEPVSRTLLEVTRGGAWYLKDLVALSCDREGVNVCGPDPDKGSPSDPNLRVNQAYQVWSLHHKTEEANDSREQVWRISQFLGCHRAPPGGQAPVITGDDAKPALLVLDDLHLGFFEDDTLWPAALRKGGEAQRIVLKTSSLPTNPLWQQLLDRFADRLTVVLPVTVLRARGAVISQALSWDKTIEETVHEFEHGASSEDLARCRRVVVHFGCAGAASFSRCSSRRFPPPKQGGKLRERAEFELFAYSPTDLEGVWKLGLPGQTFGATTILTAALARHELQPDDYPIFIAISRGLAAMRANHQVGAGAGKFVPSAAYDRIGGILHASTKEDEAASRVYFCAFPHDMLTDPVLRRQPSAKSDLVRDLTGVGFEYVAAKATEVVVWGIERALEAAPKAKYGKFVSVDREEVERLNAVRNLILLYRSNHKDRNPLSLAVFGKPGSGKSFAIEQLANEVFGRDKAVLKFNLSQFTSERQLHVAFHQARDASVHGQIPLVFWDEFDADGLKWLKHFLEPMQDASFRSGGVVHPFGRAIFVFAGGTAYDYASFDRSNASKAVRERFVQAKGPDFIGRLRGFVNVKGPNPVGTANAPGRTGTSQQSADVAYLIRRGIMLRVALEQCCPQIIDPKSGVAAVSAGVVRGFLRAKRYLHEARSLSSIVSMSTPSKGRFGAADLPPQELLELHVSPDFLTHVQQGELETSETELLAEACHKAWCAAKKKDGWTYGYPRDDKKKKHPWLVDYRQLDEAVKDENRKSARVVRAKLHDAGYEVVRTNSPARSADLRASKQRLVEIEHDVWLRDRLLRGYQWAPVTDEPLRLQRAVAPFKHVRPKDQELDAAIVEGIPPALLSKGYVIKRRTAAPGRRRAPARRRRTGK